MSAANAFVRADMEASCSRLAEIEAGLAGPEDDRWYWRAKAERRVAALEADQPLFGLVPHEAAELRELRKLLR